MNKTTKWIVAILILVGLGVAITGLFLDFMQTGIGKLSGAMTLFDDIITIEEAMPTTIVAFSIITAACAFLTLVLTVVEKGKGLKIICALLTIASAIIAVAITFAYAAEMSIGTGVAAITTTPAVGAYLLGAGGLLAGLAGLVPVNKK